MKVKLTTREPSGQPLYDMCEAGEDAVRYRRKNEIGVVPEEVAIAQDVWQAAHDAAPEGATKALMELMRAAEKVQIQSGECRMDRLIESGMHDLVQALYRLRATPEGAALLRQAQEQDDG